MEGSIAFQFLDGIGGRIARPDSYKEVDVIGLDRKSQDSPSFLFAFLFEKCLASLLEWANQKGLAPFGRPDEMIDDEMNPMLIP